MSKKIWATTLLCLLSIHLSFGQSHDFKQLNSKNYDELQAIYDALPQDSLDRKEIVASAYLTKAKKNRDSISMGRGYYLFSALNRNHALSKLYADSIITVTKHAKHKSFPALGYFLKGYWCYELDEYQESLFNYLIGDSIAKVRGNVTQYVSNRNMIALLKNRAGDYRGALKIYLKDLDSLKLIKKDSSANYLNYLNRLYNTSLTYMHLKILDSAKFYSDEGLIESLKINDSISYYGFLYNVGIIEYLSGNEDYALTKVDKALPHLDDYSKAMAYYYKGEIAIHKANEELALSYFKISDSISEELHYTFPELRNVYEYGIEHFEKKKDLSNQLFFINKLLKLDSTLSRSKDLQIEISTKYDRPLLLSKKESIIENLTLKNRYRNVVILIFSVIILVLLTSLYFYRRKQNNYLRKYNALLLKSNQSVNQDNGENPSSVDTIPVEIFNSIALGLKSFEDNCEFLSPITLAELAKNLDTNTSYLSKFININKENNFSQYLNKLRIEYVIEKLKTDRKLRSYTIKAIAEEIGYGTAQSFSKAFYLETEIYPSYFIKKLNED